MSDWWSKKLGGQPQPTQPATTPPVTPPMRGAIRIAAPMQSPYQQHQQEQYQQAPVQQRTDVLDPNRGPQEQVTMGEAMRLWKGGEAARKETNSCPSCGSGLVFSRSKGMINGAAPAPRCYECGWNGRYEQGDQSNWVS